MLYQLSYFRKYLLFVKEMRLELTRHNCHHPLKVARLPIPPPGQKVSNISKRAENETRTRDPNLGKVMLYQLSYFRICNRCFSIAVAKVGIFLISASIRNTFFSRKSALCFWQTTNVLIINSFYRDNLRRKTA